MPDSVNWIAPSEIAPGSTLATDLRDAAGLLVLPAGHPVQAEDLALAVAAGILALPVVVAAEPSPPPREAETRAHLEACFAHAGDAPSTRALLELVLTYRLSAAPGTVPPR